MKKVTFFTQNLDFGGVQKSVFLLSNFLKNKFHISIILAEDNKKTQYSFQDIDIYKIHTRKVDINKENIGEELFNYRTIELTKILEKINPDILISYEDYNNLIALSTEYNCKKIISCRVNIKDSYSNKKIHLLDELFYYNKITHLYKKANQIISVSNSIKEELKNLFSIDNVTTIHNGIEEKRDLDNEIPYKNFILNIGRLHSQKGQLDLIRAFNKIKNKTTHNLLIVGDGVLKKTLENEIIHLNLKNRVFLIGFDEPYKYIKKCSLFVFPSYYEGFSNTVLEVISSQKNVVAYNYKGSYEILFKENLVEIGNIDKLSIKILYYLNNRKENKKLEHKLKNKSKEFKLETTFEKYTKELYKLCVE